MGSVQSYIECPNCKSENCWTDYDYKRDEEVAICPDCGFLHELLWKRNEDGGFAKKDPSKDTEFTNLIRHERTVSNPFGAFRVETIAGGGTGGCLETEESYNEFISHIVSVKKQENNIKSATVSRFIDGKIIKENILE
jgi:DNA-directed RNA polymerase subunit RPC12/RpoP